MLAERSVLVTGAAGGIGRTTAITAAQHGADRVTVADVNAEGLAETASLVRSAGARCVEVSIDLRQPTQIERMITSAAEWAGGLDVLVNNAGVFDTQFTAPPQATLEELPEDAWDAVHDINVKAAWLTMKHAGPHLRRSEKSPSIVNVASIAGLTGYETPAYTSSKGAMIQLTRSAAVNLAPEVRVNCVCPGTVRTPLTEAHAGGRVAHRAHLIPRLGEPQELANVICFLAGDLATFMTGSIIPVDGGTTAWRGLQDV